MKKTIIALLMVLAALNAFALNGLITELSGEVEVKSPGAAEFAAASVGDQLSQDTVISTGFNSTALIQIGSALLTVRPLTRLTLAEIQAASGEETLNLNLQTGRVRVDLNPPSGTRATMSVSSPNATASVRGTSFEFDTRNIRVFSGSVAFKGKQNRETRLSAGSGAGIDASGAVADSAAGGSAALLPSPPVGTDPSGRTGRSASSSQGTLRINVSYPTN